MRSSGSSDGDEGAGKGRLRRATVRCDASVHGVCLRSYVPFNAGLRHAGVMSVGERVEAVLVEGRCARKGSNALQSNARVVCNAMTMLICELQRNTSLSRPHASFIPFHGPHGFDGRVPVPAPLPSDTPAQAASVETTAGEPHPVPQPPSERDGTASSRA